jgi:dihydropteroate synthase
VTGAGLRLPGRILELAPGRPVLMGVVNASPESFSDGGQVGGLEDQVARAARLVSEGAAIIDVGGESGVTDMPAVAEREEIDRVAPLIERVSASGALVSVDTWKPAVARAAVEAGAAMVNDVSGLRDPELAEICAERGAALVITHTRAEPKHKDFPDYDDVTEDVLALLREQVAVALAAGVAEDSIVVDPGPDLAMTRAQTIEVLRRLREVRDLGHPVLLAVSRKDFLGALTGRAPDERLAGTLAAVGEGVAAGASILRVHDVGQVADFLRVRGALTGDLAVPEGLELPEGLRRRRG